MIKINTIFIVARVHYATGQYVELLALILNNIIKRIFSFILVFNIFRFSFLKKFYHVFNVNE